MNVSINRITNEHRLLLLVEDNSVQANGMKSIIESTSNWRVEICENSTQAISILEEKYNTRKNIPEIVSIDLGLPPHEDDTDVGLDLLLSISSQFKGISLVVHTSLIKALDDSIIQEILNRGASFLALRDLKDTEHFSGLLNYIAEGFIVFSPRIAVRLKNIVTQKPDPLRGRKELWETLKLLEEGLTYEQVSEKMCVQPVAVTRRVKKIAEYIGIDEIEANSDPSDKLNFVYKDKVIRWYKKNRVRYGHGK